MNDFLFMLVFCCVYQANGTSVSMKIMENPSIDSFNFWLRKGKLDKKDVFKPSEFGIIPHLKELSQKCFDKVFNNYRYMLCPFKNITQEEEVLKFNAYFGIIGIWKEWLIKNNTFVHMVMDRGDLCGSNLNRKTQVKLKCQTEEKNDEIEHVQETHVCQYEVTLRTHLVCDYRSLLVYPTLSRALKSKWDSAETKLFNLELTEKGYQNELETIFIKAGYSLKNEK